MIREETATLRHRQRTENHEIKAHTKAKGVVRNSDLKMLAPLLRLDGKGLVPLPSRKVNYGVTAELVSSLEGQGSNDALAGVPIPVKITGSWDDPKYNIDLKAALAGQAGKGIGDALKSIIGGGSDGGDTSAGDASPLDQLKGLFKK